MERSRRHQGPEKIAVASVIRQLRRAEFANQSHAESGGDCREQNHNEVDLEHGQNSYQIESALDNEGIKSVEAREEHQDAAERSHCDEGVWARGDPHQLDTCIIQGPTLLGTQIDSTNHKNETKSQNTSSNKRLKRNNGFCCQRDTSFPNITFEQSFCS